MNSIYNKNIFTTSILEVEEVKQPKLTKPEKKKLKAIKRILQGEINGPKCAKLLKLTTRQVRNLKRQVIQKGDSGVVHKNHFNKPVNTYEEEIRVEIAHLYRVNYKGMNFTEFARIMKDEYGYNISRSTIYNILRQKRIRSPQRKTKKRKKLSEKNN